MIKKLVNPKYDAALTEVGGIFVIGGNILYEY